MACSRTRRCPGGAVPRTAPPHWPGQAVVADSRSATGCRSTVKQVYGYAKRARTLKKRIPDMATLCKPSVSVPEHIITVEETLEFARRVHAGKPQLPLALRLIQNTGVWKRHIVRPIEQ